MMMSVLDVVRENLHVAHDQFRRTVDGVTREMADWVPPGVAHPLGERYAHAVTAEDWLALEFAAGGKPLYASTWAGRTGFGKASEMSLFFDAEQARAFRLDDLDALRDYMNAVFAATDAYVDSFTDDDMERMFDMSMLGIPQVPAPMWWSTFITGHLHDLMGEISLLKGCLGAKGYPF